MCVAQNASVEINLEMEKYRVTAGKQPSIVRKAEFLLSRNFCLYAR